MLIIKFKLIDKVSSKGSSFIRKSYQDTDVNHSRKENTNRLSDKNSQKSENSSLKTLFKNLNNNKINLSNNENINNNSVYRETSNNFNESKNMHSVDNLITTDILLKKIGEKQFSPFKVNKVLPGRQSTLVVSEIGNQVSRFQNYFKEDNRKEDFITKMHNLNRKMTYQSSNETINLSGDMHYKSMKITYAEKKSMQFRVFWNKDKMEDISKKFRMAKEKIELKTKIFLNKIQNAIIKRDKKKIL